MANLIYTPHWSDFIAETPARQIAKSLTSGITGGWAQAFSTMKEKQEKIENLQREFAKLDKQAQINREQKKNELIEELLKEQLKDKTLYRILEDDAISDYRKALNTFGITPGIYTISQFVSKVPENIRPSFVEDFMQYAQNKNLITEVEDTSTPSISPDTTEPLQSDPMPHRGSTVPTPEITVSGKPKIKLIAIPEVNKIYQALRPEEIYEYIDRMIWKKEIPEDASSIVVVNTKNDDNKGKIYRVEGTQLIDTGRQSPTGSTMYEIPHRVFDPKSNTWTETFILSTNPAPKTSEVPLSYEDRLKLETAKVATMDQVKKELEKEAAEAKRAGIIKHLYTLADAFENSIKKALTSVIDPKKREQAAQEFNELMKSAINEYIKGTDSKGPLGKFSFRVAGLSLSTDLSKLFKGAPFNYLTQEQKNNFDSAAIAFSNLINGYNEAVKRVDESFAQITIKPYLNNKVFREQLYTPIRKYENPESIQPLIPRTQDVPPLPRQEPRKRQRW